MTSRTLLIAFDGLDPRTLDAMIEAGQMPVLASIKRGLRTAVVENYPAMGAGVFWPSVATGVLPGEHGRNFRMQFDPDTYGVAFRDDSRDFSIGAFWNELDADGMTVGIVDWSHGPVKPLRKGFMLDAWLMHEPANIFKSSPPSLAEEVRATYGTDPWQGGLARALPKSSDDFRALSQIAVERIRLKTRFCVSKLKESRWDFFAPTFSEAHDVGHYALHLVDRSHWEFDAALVAETGDPMLAVCRAFDEAAGLLLEAAGPDAAVCVIGGPGMTTQISGNAAMETICRRLDVGYDERAEKVEKVQSAYRSAAPLAVRQALSPIVRRFLRRPPSLPENASRRFFSVPNTDNSGAVRVNLKGREKHGIVEPQEYDRLLAEIAACFDEITDAQTGEKIVGRCVFARKEFPGAQAENLPDLFVVWRRERPFTQITSPKIGVISDIEQSRRGDHTPYGFFWAPTAESFPAVLRPHETTAVLRSATRGVIPVPV